MSKTEIEPVADATAGVAEPPIMELLGLDDLDIASKSSKPYEMPYICPKRGKTGVVFLVLGDESEEVSTGMNKLLNELRAANAKRQADAIEAEVLTGQKSPPHYDRIEDNHSFAAKAAALRVVGWRGVREPFSKEAALQITTRNSSAREQIRACSGKVANFI